MFKGNLSLLLWLQRLRVRLKGPDKYIENWEEVSVLDKILKEEGVLVPEGKIFDPSH